VLVDTDMGYDDVMAIAMLLAAGVPIAGITTVDGLAGAERGAWNMLRLLERTGQRGVPVASGAATPLVGDRAFPAPWRAEADALPGIALPSTDLMPQPLPADEFLLSAVDMASRPVTLLCLGPLTNVALALRRDARALRRRVARIVVMGGAVRVPGNDTPNGVSEWNFYVDPAAAHEVVCSEIPIVMVGLDATNLAPRTDDHVGALCRRAAREPVGRIMQEALRCMYAYLYDQVAAACLLDPAVVRVARLPIRVVPEGNIAGQTIEDPAGSPIDVALGLDQRRFHDLLRGLFV
jgi:inosine-uridine nucleoside N-ribohydrolase